MGKIRESQQRNANKETEKNLCDRLKREIRATNERLFRFTRTPCGGLTATFLYRPLFSGTRTSPRSCGISKPHKGSVVAAFAAAAGGGRAKTGPPPPPTENLPPC